MSFISDRTSALSLSTSAPVGAIALTLFTRSIVPTIQSRSQSVPERESHFSHETDRTNNRISVVRDDRIYTNLQEVGKESLKFLFA